MMIRIVGHMNSVASQQARAGSESHCNRSRPDGIGRQSVLPGDVSSDALNPEQV